MSERDERCSDRDHEAHNVVVLAVHQIVVRVAWVFKTESVIVPAFMDFIAGAGWLRGCLPVLNKLGQSIPPLLFAEKLRNASLKKRTLIFSSVAMGVPFLILAVLWWVLGVQQTDPQRRQWLPYAFLVLYAFFFSAVGINNLAFGTVQGKLVRANRRGRLMSLAGVIGTFFSVAGLLWLLTEWLQRDDGGFTHIFGLTGIGFLLAGLVAALVRETPDIGGTTRWAFVERFVDAAEMFRSDARFRRLAIVSMCFCPLMVLFPHYQALGRDGASIQHSAADLVGWVIAQNVAIGVYSLFAGSLADRFGNRLVLRAQMAIGAATPLVAMTLASTDRNDWYWVTFVFLGIAPVTVRTLMNFNLELTEPKNHPRYVSTMSVCNAIPFLASPLVGAMIDAIGFGAVMTGCSAIIATGCVLTLWLPEPRHEDER